MLLTRRGLLTGAVAVPLASALGGCGTSSGTDPTSGEGNANTKDKTAGSTSAPVTTVTVRSSGLFFDVTTIHVPVRTPVTITYRNDHTGVPHNIHIRGTGVDAKTPVKPGPANQTLTVTLPQPGDYPYICDIHPEMMTGVIKAL